MKQGQKMSEKVFPGSSPKQLLNWPTPINLFSSFLIVLFTTYVECYSSLENIVVDQAKDIRSFLYLGACN